VTLILIIIFLAAIAYSAKRGGGSGPDIKETATDPSKPYSSKSAVAKDYANEAIKFFDNYLTLCQKHSVVGISDLLGVEIDDKGNIKTRIKCTIIAVDDERADDVFDGIKRICTERSKEKMGSGDYFAAAHAGDSYIEEYFGCENLHYAYTEVDDWEFEDREVIISFEKTICNYSGEKLQPTLSFIKQELQNKWENVTIDIGRNGMSVKQQDAILRKRD